MQKGLLHSKPDTSSGKESSCTTPLLSPGREGKQARGWELAGTWRPSIYLSQKLHVVEGGSKS